MSLLFPFSVSPAWIAMEPTRCFCVIYLLPKE